MDEEDVLIENCRNYIRVRESLGSFQIVDYSGRNTRCTIKETRVIVLSDESHA